MWKRIILNDTISRYAITLNGDVINLRTNKYLKTFISNSGYESVKLYLQGRSYSFMIHRLVADAFVYKDPNKEDLQVNHKNGDKLDNHYSNLEWCTRSENIKHSYDKLNRIRNRGERCCFSKYTENTIIQVCEHIQNGYSLKYISDEFDIRIKYLYDIRNHKRWSHITKNYLF